MFVKVFILENKLGQTLDTQYKVSMYVLLV